jgi:hypothetical protein
MLGTMAVPLLAEMAANPEFEPQEISEVEFEGCWREQVR